MAHGLGVVNDWGGYLGLLSTIYILDKVAKPLRVLVNGHHIFQCIVESLLVILEVFLCNFPVSFHYVVYKINYLDSHKARVCVTEFSDVGVFHRPNHLVYEYLFHGGKQFMFSIVLCVYCWPVDDVRRWHFP